MPSIASILCYQYDIYPLVVLDDDGEDQKMKKEVMKNGDKYEKTMFLL
jgi:hypothetical protein